MATFPARVKEQRLKKGLSQPQLAEEIGLTKQTISLWERGVSRPEFETMDRLAEYFGVSMRYLIGQSDDPAVYEPTDDDGANWAESEVVKEIENLGGLISQLSDDTRQLVAAMIREAYRIDRVEERLVDGYTVSVTGKKRRLMKE